MSTSKKVEKNSFFKTHLKASPEYTRTGKILASHLQCSMRPKTKLEIILNETRRGIEKRMEGSGLESIGARDQPEVKGRDPHVSPRFIKCIVICVCACMCIGYLV